MATPSGSPPTSWAKSFLASTRGVKKSVGSTTFQRGVPTPTFGYFQFDPGSPQTIELEAKFGERYMVKITPWGISDDDYLIKKNGIDAYKARLL